MKKTEFEKIVDEEFAKNARAYKVAELCCGGGGATCGFALAGFRTVLGCDFWSPGLKVFEKNHPGAVAVHGDLTKQEVKDRVVKELKERGCDVLFAGVPCPPFSQANSKRDLQEVEKDPRSHLFRHVCEVVSKVKPSVVVLENVKGMLQTKYEGVPSHERIIRELAAISYKGEYRLLNACDYGVPESRVRIIFIATPFKTGIRFPAATHSESGKDGLHKWVTAREAIGHLEDAPADEGRDHVPHKPGSGILKELGAALPGKRLNEEARRYRADADKPFHTVTTEGGLVYHYKRPRALTVRELACAQSFPETYAFGASVDVATTVIGNAVPPGLARAIASEVEAMLDEIRARKPRLLTAKELRGHVADVASRDGLNAEIAVARDRTIEVLNAEEAKVDRSALRQGESVEEFFKAVNPRGEMTESAVYDLLMTSKDCRHHKSQLMNLRGYYLLHRELAEKAGKAPAVSPTHYARVCLADLTLDDKRALLEKAEEEKLNVLELHQAVVEKLGAPAREVALDDLLQAAVERARRSFEALAEKFAGKGKAPNVGNRNAVRGLIRFVTKHFLGRVPPRPAKGEVIAMPRRDRVEKAQVEMRKAA